MNNSTNRRGAKVDDTQLQKIKQILGEISYGSVLIIVQDSKIVQIDKNEKIRLK